MKKTLILLLIFTLMILVPLRVDAYSKQDLYLRDDLIIELLGPRIEKEIKRHFGKTKQYDCAQVKQLKKIDQGSYLFTTVIQVVTFEGPHNPPSYVINITFSNGGPGWEWKVINSKANC